MSRHRKKYKIQLTFNDGKTEVIPQKFWDDYEVNYGLFVLKKNEEWVAFYKLDIIDCMVVKRQK